jgi:hypothetical protein
MNQHSEKDLLHIADGLRNWTITPAGTEGYNKAEVTRGGVDTRDLSSKTLEAQNVPGLYFIGEVADVTGQLGGYNLHWAWASGHPLPVGGCCSLKPRISTLWLFTPGFCSPSSWLFRPSWRSISSGMVFAMRRIPTRDALFA